MSYDVMQLLPCTWQEPDNVRLVGVLNTMGSHFGPLRCFKQMRNVRTMSNSANIVLSLLIQWRWR